MKFKKTEDFKIDFDSYQHREFVEVENAKGDRLDEGSVLVTIDGETKRYEAYLFESEILGTHVTVELLGRIAPNGKKWFHVSADVYEDGRIETYLIRGDGFNSRSDLHISFIDRHVVREESER